MAQEGRSRAANERDIAINRAYYDEMKKVKAARAAEKDRLTAHARHKISNSDKIDEPDKPNNKEDTSADALAVQAQHKVRKLSEEKEVVEASE